MAFTSRHQEKIVLNSKNDHSIDSDNIEEIVDFDELKEAYDKSFEESLKITKQNSKLVRKSEVAEFGLVKALASARELSRSLD